MAEGSEALVSATGEEAVGKEATRREEVGSAVEAREEVVTVGGGGGRAGRGRG